MHKRMLTVGALGLLALGSMGFSFGDPQVCVDLVINVLGQGGAESFCLPG